METPVSVLERHFGVDGLGEDAIAFLKSRPWNAWQEFSFLYKTQYAENFLSLNRESLKKKNDELSPYLFEYFPYDDALWTPRDDAARDADQVMHALKRLLLFHHRVFVPDWFLWLLDYVRLGAADSEDANMHLGFVFEYLRVLGAIRPLFEEGIVNFIPTEALVTSPIVAGRYRPTLDREQLRTDLPQLTDKGYVFFGGNGLIADANNLDKVEQATQSRLNEVLQYIENAEALGLDIILPNRRTALVFNHWVTSTAKPQVSFNETLPMPGLDRLRIEDLVKIRQNDDDFAQWRDELRQIYQLGRQNREFETNPAQFSADAAARLHAKRDAIEKGSAAKGFADTIKSKVMTIGLGAFGTIAANLLIPGGGLVVSLLGAFLGGGAGLAVDTAKHAAGAPRREALVRLYSVFDAS